MPFESEKVEYKTQMLEDLYKEVIAFANTEGGTVYIGVDDRGNVTGIDNVDDTYTRATNGIRDAIQPDVSMFVRTMLEDNQTLRIEVGEGSHKPYYLKSKGIKSTGVFVRQGTSSVPASPEQIRRMIKTSDGDVFESMRAMEQTLTFRAAEAAFLRYNVAFSKDKYLALGLKSLQDGQYTNLAWILSDQCQHTTKVAVFGDAANTVFKDAKEFSGSIFQQLEDAFSYLMLCNRTAASFEGLNRIDKSDYPQEALREALLNALVHRDYSFSGSTIINVNDAGMAFISIGGLLPGLSAEDIRSGISQPRNRNLAEIFHRLRLIEAYGTGIRRIYSLYQSSALQPRIEVTPNTFKMSLPNMNGMAAQEAKPSRPSEASLAITPQMQLVLDYLEAYGEMSDEELQELLNVKRTRAYLLARQMHQDGLLEIEGRGAGKRYRRR